jgi:lipopolysaccharide transport system permease protein
LNRQTGEVILLHQGDDLESSSLRSQNTPIQITDAVPLERAHSAENPEPIETIIEPSSGWQSLGISEFWRYRELLFFLAWRDIKVRYKQTVLGVAWAICQPVLLMSIFWLFLGKVAKVPTGELPYALFVFSGLIPWFLFSTAVSAASNSLLDSERLLSKVYFPRLAVPFAASGPAVFDFCITMVLLGIVMAIGGIIPGWTIFLAFLPITVIILTALGVGTFLAALNVSYRDFRYVVPFLIQVWLFATPSIYLATHTLSDDLPELVKWVMVANPMTGLIEFFRAALFGLELPWQSFGLATLVGIAFFVLGCTYFRRVEDTFADII